MTITYAFSECDSELRVISQLAAPFLENGYLLDTFRDQLSQIRYSKSPGAWSLPIEQPLRTIPCAGGYEKPGRAAAHAEVHGELSAIWEITPIPPKKKKLLPERFVVSGKASSLIRLAEDISDERVDYVSWRIEIGDEASPGVFFHIQIGEDREGPYHQPLPVPRLAAAPSTPMQALEYLLLEIFQDRWPERLKEEPERVNAWRNIQKPRLARFYAWQQEILLRRVGSPISDLKHEKPRTDLFVDGAPLLRSL